MNRPALACLALALATFCSTLPAQQPGVFSIGTWNIEFLGAAPHLRRETPPRTNVDMQAIGKQLNELGVCVLGVQEICGEQPMRVVAEAAGPQWRFVLGTSGSWSDGKTQQGIGFFYDASQVDLLHAEELLDFPSKVEELSVFHRKPVTACFRHRATGCDFRTIVVHLKAGRKARDEAKRRAEATYLSNYLQRLRSDSNEDQDIVVLGDFNCTYGTEPETIFERDGKMVYVDEQKPAPTIMHFDDPIDQIVVSTSFAELQPRSRVVHHVRGEAERLAWRRTYSDHFPVTVSLRASGDDDQATFARGPVAQVLPASERPPKPVVKPLFAVGQKVIIRTQQGLTFAGVLKQPLPEGPGGWAVIATDQGTVAIPYPQVQTVQAR